MENTTNENYINQGVIYINDPTCCFICKKTGLDPESTYCAACGFPQGGEQEDKIRFYREHITNQVAFQEAMKSVKSAQTTLFVTAGLAVLSGLILGALQPEDGAVTLIGALIMAAIFLGLGIWAKQNPMVSIIAGFVIYVSVLLFSIGYFIYDEGRSGRPFGIMDIIILIYLGRGVAGVVKAERIRKEKGWDWRTEL